MFDLNHAISQWRQEMTANGINSPEVLDELEGHLRDHMRRLASGLPEHEAFQIAVRELGEAKMLKREFARANRLPLLNWRENPAVLNVVGAWLILMGLNAVSQIVFLAIYGVYRGSLPLFLGVASFCALFSLQIPAGIGVLRHVRLWRHCAFFLLGVKCLTSGMALFSYATHTVANQSPGHFFILMGIHVPMHYAGLWDFIAVAMSLFAIYVLTRPAIRDLFRSTPEMQLI